MEGLLYSYCGSDYRVEVRVPTDIFDITDGVYAKIVVYKGTKISRKSREILGHEFVKLEKMPYWNTPLQTILLRRGDIGKVDRGLEHLLKKLEREGLIRNK